MSKNEKKRIGKWRIALGTFVTLLVFCLAAFLIFWAYVVSLTENGTAIPNWILTFVIIVILYLYMYGILGAWLNELSSSPKKFIKIIGNVLGYIGIILRPFPIIAYGSNKKSTLLLTAGLPLLIIGITSIILGVAFPEVCNLIPLPDGAKSGTWELLFIIIGILALVNTLFVLSVKKCPNCKCVMCEIDFKLTGSKTESYSRDFSEQIGYISDGNGHSADVYQNYSVGYEGNRVTHTKTYTCHNCGTQVNGKSFSVLQADNDDHIAKL